MNNRYLFRAKRIDNGEWVEGMPLFYQDGSITIYGQKQAQTVGFHIQNNGYCDRNTLCQCTGLNDKNGKLIWENDVVYMRCNGLSGYGNVIYENGCFWIDDKKRGRKYPFSNYDVKYRVDGNIFDNPELMHE